MILHIITTNYDYNLMEDVFKMCPRYTLQFKGFNKMDKFENITAFDVKKLMVGRVVSFADIRDLDSYNTRHIDGAKHLTNDNLQEFIQESDPDGTLVIYCFHGHSSQPAAQLLVDRGFENVYSLIGGFEGWIDTINHS
jgi:thiosulfate sulfurtransferase